MPTYNPAAPDHIVQRLRQELQTDRIRLTVDIHAMKVRERAAIDRLEEKSMVSTALAAAASGTPFQARAMLAKIRARAIRAAADGADTAALEAMVRDMERLTKITARNEQRERHGAVDKSAAGLPALTASQPPGFLTIK